MKEWENRTEWTGKEICASACHDSTFPASVLLSTTIIKRCWKFFEEKAKGHIKHQIGLLIFFSPPETIKDFQITKVFQENDYPVSPNTKLSIVQGNQKEVVIVFLDATVMQHLWSLGAFKVVPLSTQVLSLYPKECFGQFFNCFKKSPVKHHTKLVWHYYYYYIHHHFYWIFS